MKLVTGGFTTSSLAILLSLSLQQQAVPVTSQEILVDDFELNIALGQYRSPTKLIFSETGILWVTDKNGLLYVAEPGFYDEPVLALDLESVICDNGERGLESVAPHPKFDGNQYPYVWISYNYNKHNSCDESATIGPVLRLSRFTCTTIECDRTSEMVYLETAPFPYDHHNGGDIAFGADGKLYMTIGDGGESPFAQDLFSLFGTLIRLNPDDNTVPNSNPFAGSNGGVRCGLKGGYSGSADVPCSEIYAYGLRNPFRLTMNPNPSASTAGAKKVEFYINDVGAGMWEEVSVGGDDYKGANYGWPIREGPCDKGRNCGDRCAMNTENFVEPIHYYLHNEQGDGAITAGAFVPKTGRWPASYEGTYLYGDFVFGQLFQMNYQQGQESRTSCPIRSNYDVTPLIKFDNSYLVSMAFSPLDGHLYFMSRGGGGRLNRIRYIGNNPATYIGNSGGGGGGGNNQSNNGNGGNGTNNGNGSNSNSGNMNSNATNAIINNGPVNRAPQPIIRTSSTGGPPGTTVSFDGSKSTDPDKTDNLMFEWDFNGDGIVDSTKVIASCTYHTAGIYQASLKVRDGKGGRSTSYVEIGIGQYPNVEMTVPAEGAEFYVGQLFILTATATGANLAKPNESMVWEVRQHHNEHYHPYLDPTEGNFIVLQPCPSPEDLVAATNSYLEIILTVTDDLGLKTTITRNLLPQLRAVDFDSVPQGLNILVDGFEITTPKTIVSWVNHPLRVEALDHEDPDENLKWSSWSNGGNQAHEVTIPQTAHGATGLHLVASYGDDPSPTHTPTTEAPFSLPAIIGDKPSVTTEAPFSLPAIIADKPSVVSPPGTLAPTQMVTSTTTTTTSTTTLTTDDSSTTAATSPATTNIRTNASKAGDRRVVPNKKTIILPCIMGLVSMAALF